MGGWRWTQTGFIIKIGSGMFEWFYWEEMVNL
jgi:hypothetical protein